MRKRKNRRKRKKKVTDKMVSGIVWYQPDQWARMREVVADPECLEETYEEWLKVASKAVKDLSKLGLRVLKVEIDADEFVSWCKSKGVELDAPARARFVGEKLRSAQNE